MLVFLLASFPECSDFSRSQAKLLLPFPVDLFSQQDFKITIIVSYNKYEYDTAMFVFNDNKA